MVVILLLLVIDVCSVGLLFVFDEVDGVRSIDILVWELMIYWGVFVVFWYKDWLE